MYLLEGQKTGNTGTGLRMYDQAFVGLSRDQLDQIDATCDLFEESQLSDSPHQIEDYLAAADERIRGPLLRELLDIEIGARRNAGQEPNVIEYQSRFPEFADFVTRAIEESSERVAQTQTRVASLDDTDPFAFRLAGVAELPGVAGDPSNLPIDFGRYRLLKLLGRGGMGAVFLAHDTQLDRQVALKMPEFNGCRDAVQPMIDRFHREARVMATVNHPNLCQIHDVGQHDGHPYLTMSYIDGQPLSEMIEDGQPIPAVEAVRIVRTLALAVDAVHQAGIVHRDLKPANVMVDRHQSLFLTDFGLASRNNPIDPGLTHENTVIGSPAYMAPEQVRCEADQIGPATEVYSLGVILYELLCGRRPFTGSGLEVLGEITSGTSPPPPSEHVRVDEKLEAVCLKAMAYRAEDRFPTAAELVAALDQFSQQLRGRPDQASRSSGKRDAPLKDPMPDRRHYVPRLGRLITLLVLMTAVISVAAITVYKIKTPYGEVVVHAAEGIGVEVEVRDKGNLVAVLGPKNSWQVRIEAGTYQLKLRKSGHELSLDKNTVEVSRDGRVEVTIVSRTSQPPVGPAAIADGGTDFALLFDGESTHAYVPELARPDSGPMTLEAWINPLRPSGSRTIARLGGKSLLQLGISDNDLFAIDWMAGTPNKEALQDFNPAANTYVADQWVHVAAVSETDEVRFYVNGVRAWRMARTPKTKDYPLGGLWIGGQAEGEAIKFHFVGQVDELRVSTVARYVEDFKPQATFEPDDHTVALYHFGEGQGQKLIDSSGKNHHGRIVAGKWVKVVGRAQERAAPKPQQPAGSALLPPRPKPTAKSSGKFHDTGQRLGNSQVSAWNSSSIQKRQLAGAITLTWLMLTMTATWICSWSIITTTSSGSRFSCFTTMAPATSI